MLADPAFYAVAIPAVILQGLSKGGLAGLSVLAMPLLGLVISPVQAAAIMLPILIIQDVFSVWVYRRSWDAANLRLLLPAAVIGILTAYLLAARVDDAAVALALGTISVVFALRWFIQLGLGSGGQRPPAPPQRLSGWLWGAVAGFTSMIAHAGGPPFQIHMLPQRLPREIFVGTGVVFFAAVNWLKAGPYIALGQFTAGNVLTSLVLFPLAIASTWAGVWLVRRFTSDRFYVVIHGLLLVIGLKLVADGTGLTR